jgi:hypothetical protein
LDKEGGLRKRECPTLATMKLSRRWGTRFCGWRRESSLVSESNQIPSLRYGMTNKRANTEILAAPE